MNDITIALTKVQNKYRATMFPIEGWEKCNCGTCISAVPQLGCELFVSPFCSSGKEAIEYVINACNDPKIRKEFSLDNERILPYIHEENLIFVPIK